ncbi:inositol monophosphatase family protein [Nannocystaceae bacterium ST9]
MQRPSPETLLSWREQVEAIAREAASFVLSGYRSGAAITKKGPIDLVTQYDLECERLIRDRLAAALPSHRIVGEEADPQGEGELVWFVDPIDGTTNFAHGHPFFCVSIGLFQAGAPLVGIIDAPALGVRWSAHAGGGATRDGALVRVSERETLADSLCATGFAYDRWQAVDDNLGEHDAFVKSTRGVRRCGSAALDLALTAEGTYDLYWEQSLKPWDMAAGMVLVHEAGGTLSDYLGRATRPEAGQVVASNGRVHAQALATLAEARRARGLPPEGTKR